MRVYHYLEAKWALEDIRSGWLKLSKINDMNDPYEFESVCSDHKPSQWVLDMTKRKTVEENGVLCFSLSWNDILMWSHYGERHKGICLGFDVPDELTKTVTYLRDVLVVENLIDAPTEEQMRIVDLLCYAKYEGWFYEKEVRVIGMRKEIDEKTGKYFVSFGEHLRLKEVITGVSFPMSNRPLIEDALKDYEDVKIVKTVKSVKRFEILVDEHSLDGGPRQI